MGVPLGFDNFVPTEGIVYVGNSDTSIAKKLIREAGEGRIIDCCRGKLRRSVVLLSSGYLYYSHLSPETINNRWRQEKAHEMLGKAEK